MLLENRHCIVSGVGRGLGQAIALALAREGADVVLVARNVAYLESVVGLVEAAGGQALAVGTDITDPGQCARVVAAAVDRFGSVDVLVNNAAAAHPKARVEDGDLDDWRRSLEVMVFGSMNLTRAVIPSMRDGGGGSVVMIGSMIVRKVDSAAMPGYGAAKAALIHLARTLAHELGPDRIRVNTVVPGWMWGPSAQKVILNMAAAEGVAESEIVARIASNIPLGAIPSQEDCANAVVFFASDLSQVITGQALDVNGGEAFH
jgi:NAD(P)-dependent dehydrogenase (short-subunit alcohol dehydrogenase family)